MLSRLSALLFGLVLLSGGPAFGAAHDYVTQETTRDYGSVVTPGTTSQTGPTQTNGYDRGVVCIISVTALTGTSITFTLKGRDNIDGVDYTILASAAETATGTYVLRVYPGIAVTANVTASDVLPRYWHLDTTDSAVTAITSTVDCQGIS